MTSPFRHLVWSFTLLFLGIFLFSICVSLLKISGVGLTFAQTMALIFVGSLASAAPFAGVVWSRWNLKSRIEYVCLFTFGALLAGGYAADFVCSQRMLHGEFLFFCFCCHVLLSFDFLFVRFVMVCF